MTRRHKDLSNDGCIAGLRLEADLAKRLAEEARARSDGNVSELARYYLRTGCGLSHSEANHREATIKPTKLVRGLRIEEDLARRLDRVTGHARLVGRAAGARHLIRLGLGYEEEESIRREAGFAAIASARQGLHDVFHGASDE